MPPRRPRPRGASRVQSYTSAPTNAALKTVTWENVRKFVLARDMWRCHVCLHTCPPGLRKGMAVDHDPVPLAEIETRGISVFDVTNLKAIHGRVPCPTCEQAAAALGNRAGYCNSIKGQGSLLRAQKLVSAKTGLVIGNIRPDGKFTDAGGMPKGEREWL